MPAGRGNAVVAQSGGPTAVINQSVVGVVEGLRTGGFEGKVFGARHGVRGMTTDAFLDLGAVPQSTLDLVATTPSAALGSTRDKPDAAYCERIVAALKARDIRLFFYIGGNDSSDTCRIVSELARKAGYPLQAVHVPKTIDNDLVRNDHTPGYPSAARFVARAFQGDNLDNAALPGIKINVVMGRHAGFLTAASALARQQEDDGPHLVCVPERPFEMNDFVAAVEQSVKKRGRCLIAVSEGIQDSRGETIATTLAAGAREVDAHGNVQLSGSGALGDLLAGELKKALTPAGGKPPRVRADTFGYVQRCWPEQSAVDAREAREVGRFAAHHALQGADASTVAIERTSNNPYGFRLSLLPVSEVAAKTRHMDDAFLARGFDVTPAFLDYLRPLVGDLPKMGRL